ncbi:hypothetical protein F5Y03DRAFT_168925 [Xylaria venustula]|nr:hypothetical protein F5Y03DRAFT_168925 [Xylaria venustula]
MDYHSVLCDEPTVFILSAVDFDIRTLTSYHLLKAGAPFDFTVNLNLLDKSAPSIALKQWQIGALFGLATTFAMFTANFLTVFTSSLFATTSISRAVPSQISTVNSFLTSDPKVFNNTDGYISALAVLEANLSYPAFTYQNLAIPGLALSPDFIIGSDATANPSLVSNAVVLAFRTGLTCKLYNSSRFVIRLFSDSQDGVTPYEISIGIRGLTYNLNDKGEEDDIFWLPPNYFLQTEGPFGLVNKDPISSYQYLYIWGNIDSRSSTNFTFASGMTCNDTLEAVDIKANFLGASLDIDASKPPVPIEATTRSIIPSTFDIELLESGGSSDILGIFGPGGEVYQLLPPIQGPSDNLDHFFSILTTSRYAQPLSALRDPARHKEIADAIKFQHSIIAAAMLNTQSRVPFNNTNVTIHPSGNDINIYNAIVTYPIAETRVVQDATSTRILQTLLATVLILFIVSWVFMPNTALLPNHPTSVASAVALLIGGNIFSLLPLNSVSMSDKELKTYFLSLGFDKFQMGWGIVQRGNEDGQRERLMVCAVSSNESDLINSNL